MHNMIVIIFTFLTSHIFLPIMSMSHMSVSYPHRFNNHGLVAEIVIAGSSAPEISGAIF
jgi:hypothetical protein